jgi:hypothetical protein
MTPKSYSYDEIRQMVTDEVKAHGMSRKAWAEAYGLGYTYLNHFMVKDCAPPPEILTYFGLRRVIIKIGE